MLSPEHSATCDSRTYLNCIINRYILSGFSVAFDWVNHKILLSFPQDYVDLDDQVLKLFETYLANRAQCVSIAYVLSERSDLAFGVPQGSDFGLSAFCTFTIPLDAILQH